MWADTGAGINTAATRKVAPCFYSIPTIDDPASAISTEFLHHATIYPVILRRRDYEIAKSTAREGAKMSPTTVGGTEPPKRGRRVLYFTGKVTGLLVILGGIAGLVPVVFDESIKTALATNIDSDSMTSVREGNELSSQLIDVAQRGGVAEFFQGRFTEINITADKGIAPATVRETTAPDGRKIPPHIILPTDRCPRSPGTQTTLRVFLYGPSIGSDNIGNPDSGTVAVRGDFTLSELLSPGPRSPGISCWIDATEK